MAEIISERWTRCPTGNPKDEIFFEIVLEDSNPLDASDPTPRTTILFRVFSRGDAQALKGRERDCIFTTGKDAARIIVESLRLSTLVEKNLAGLFLTLTWPVERSRARTWDYYGGPAKGDLPPTVGTLFDDYKARAPKPTPRPARP